MILCGLSFWISEKIRLVQKQLWFRIVEFAFWYWNTFSNKSSHVIHHFNARFLLYVFYANYLLLAIYFIYILDYGNDIRQKENLSDFLIRVQNGS